MAVSGCVRVAALFVAPWLVGCDVSTEPGDGGQVAVAEFRIERAEPPGEPVDGKLAVASRARLTFAFTVEGPVETLVLSAGERVLAELSPDTVSYVDDCDAGSCGTADAGETVYTLAAVGSGDDPSVDARSLAVQVAESAAPLRNKR